MFMSFTTFKTQEKEHNDDSEPEASHLYLAFDE